MNKNRFAILLVIIAAFLPTAKAYMAASKKTVEFESGIAPFNGRSNERDFYTLLNNTGREYESWIKDGNKYLKRTEYEQAIWAFRKAVRLRPASEEARFLLAFAYEKRLMEGLPGDFTNWEKLAEKEYEAAIAVADHLPSRFNLAVMKRRQGAFNEARKNLEHILLIGNPQNILVKKANKLLEELFEQDVRPNSMSFGIVCDSEDLCRE